MNGVAKEQSMSLVHVKYAHQYTYAQAELSDACKLGV